MARPKLICEAIRKRALLAFQYQGRPRVVAPYCLGISTRGVDVLRAVQVRGLSASGALGLGKLWTVADMVEPHLLAETFIPDDQNYNPDDSAMQIGLVGVSASPRRRNVIQKRRHTTVIQRT